MPKWDSGTHDCEEQDLIMQAGPPLQATPLKHMRSRLQRARSRAVVDGKETSVARDAPCNVYWEDHGQQLMAYALCGIALAENSKAGPSGGAKQRRDCCGTCRVGLFKAGKSHGAAPAAVLGSPCATACTSH
jgi:hypothetical protein